MKKAVILAFTLAFISAVGSALTPSVASLTDEALAMILGNPGATGSCPRPWADENEVVFAARRLGLAKICNAQITCWDGSSLSCSNPGNGTCASTQSNCNSGVRGSINCGSIILAHHVRAAISSAASVNQQVTASLVAAAPAFR